MIFLGRGRGLIAATLANLMSAAAAGFFLSLRSAGYG